MTGADLFPSLGEAERRAGAGARPWALFEERVRTPREALAALRPEPAAEGARAVAAALEDGPEEAPERVAYVHVPFCRTVCPFCAYPRERLGEGARVADFVGALARQAEAWGASRWARARPFAALHFGGGSPTALPLPALCDLIGRVSRSLPLEAGAEVTVESTPGALDGAGAAALAGAGVTRVALGVQSFDTAFRRTLGRGTERDEVLRRIAAIRAAGIGNLCVDLLYGLPDQREETWAQDLETARRCGATGASAYPFVAEPGSAFGRSLAAAGRRTFASLEEEHALHAAADDALGAAPWERVSPVQFGESESGGAAYVAAYGRGADVLGLGPGAHGSIGPLGYAVAGDVEPYLAAPVTGSALPVRAWRAGGRQGAARRLLRLATTGRLDVKEGASILPSFPEVAGRLQGLGLVEVRGGEAHLTREGRFWAGNIGRMLAEAV